jgi:hypothetical protein
MLYHLIQLNPNKDISLHVSANNPAMVCLDVLIFLCSHFHTCGYNSFYTTALVLRQKNSWLASTTTILILSRVHRRMRSDFDFVGDLCFRDVRGHSFHKCSPCALWFAGNYIPSSSALNVLTQVNVAATVISNVSYILWMF